jgi:hypothetical protein
VQKAEHAEKTAQVKAPTPVSQTSITTTTAATFAIVATATVATVATASSAVYDRVRYRANAGLGP